MHQNPFTSPDSPGSSKFPCSRGRSACWARFRRSDRCFKLSCRWRKETLQDWEVSGRNHVVCLETHTNLETLEPWVSSESLLVGHFSLVVALPIITPLWSCNVKKTKRILHHPCLILILLQMSALSAIPQTCSSISSRPRLVLGSSTCRWWHLVCKAFNCISRFKRGSSNSSKGGASLGAVAAAFQHIHGFKGMAYALYALCLHRLCIQLSTSILWNKNPVKTSFWHSSSAVLWWVAVMRSAFLISVHVLCLDLE